MSINSQSGSQHLGKYELRERLGRGGMAEVWKAFDPQLHRYVAIKFLHADLQSDPEFITRFSREACVIASLHHPNIVQIHDFQTTQSSEANASSAYMVMDYVEGQTLAQYIRSTSHAGKFPSPMEIIRLFTSISKAVDYAHQQGMIHRDIKPANILLDKRNTSLNAMGEPVLTDFGIAKLLDSAAGTVSGMWLGTPLYVSPEQAQGHPGNERSDIYSLGVILYEICAGVQPFRGENATAIRWQHVYSVPTPPSLINPNISPALAMVILRALAKNPTERFSSASEMMIAMIEAFNLPIPSDLALPSHALDYMTAPTYLSPIRSNLQPLTPSSMQSPSSMPEIALERQPWSAQLMPPPLTVSSTGEPRSPVAPGNSTPAGSAPPPAGPNASFSAPLPMSPAMRSPVTPLPPAPRPSRGWKRPLIIVLLILLLLAGSTIGALYLFSAKNITTGPAPVVGNVFFLSSLQLNKMNSTGVDDEVQINLHGISDPAPGKSYDAWLKNAPINDEGQWILLGILQKNQGIWQLPNPYTDPQHANLLLNATSFLVTEENNSLPSVQPASDRSTWQFYSEPPIAILTHLRHLLSMSPELEARTLEGGLGIWFWRNTEKLVEWATSARDTWSAPRPDTGLIHRQMEHILDYIDGQLSVSMDVPANSPPGDFAAIQQEAQIAIVGPQVTLHAPGYAYNQKGDIPPGYVYLIRIHLDAAVQSPRATTAQRQLAKQIEDALNQVKLDLDQAHQYAKQLVVLSSTQLLTQDSLNLLNNLAAAVESAAGGPIDPGLPQGGAQGVYINLQRLASFQVQTY